MLFATSKGQRASVAPLRVAPGALPPPSFPQRVPEATATTLWIFVRRRFVRSATMAPCCG